MNELWQMPPVRRAQGPRADRRDGVAAGLGVGASTTIFSAINGVVRRPLPYLDPDRLVTLASPTHVRT